MVSRVKFLAVLTVAGLLGGLLPLAKSMTDHENKHLQTSGQFAGPKASKGTVHAEKEDGKLVLRLSEDFVVPETPDPHWQLVDSQGNVYLAQRLEIKGDGVNTRIEVPAYVKDVARVQIWCAFAETNLGEASFTQAVK